MDQKLIEKIQKSDLSEEDKILIIKYIEVNDWRKLLEFVFKASSLVNLVKDIFGDSD